MVELASVASSGSSDPQRRAEYLLHSIIDAMPDVTVVIDRDYRIVLANRAARAAAGGADPVAECLLCYEVLHRRAAPCEGRKDPCPLQTVITTKAPVVTTHTHYDAQGREVFVDVRASPVFDEAGEVSHVIELCRDITARKRREERVVSLSRWKERLLGPGGLPERLQLITDAVVEVFGAEFARIWVIKPGDLCDKGCRHALVTEGPDACRNRRRCLRLVANSGRYTAVGGSHRRVPLGCYKIGRIASGDNAKLLTNDVTHDPQVHDHGWAASLGLVSFAGYRLLSPERKPLGVMALFSRQAIDADDDAMLEDLANTASQVIRAGMAEEALRESEAKTRQTQQQLLELQRREKELVETELNKVRETLVRQTRLATVGQLSASIAHELRNPLATIGNAEFLLRKMGPKEAAWRRYLEIIRNELSDANEIITDCLALSQSRPPTKSPVALPPIISKARAHVHAPEPVAWHFVFQPDPFVIHADAAQVEQVFRNLFHNSVQALGGAGRISVEAVQGDEYDEILVADNGPGVAAEVREQVFEPLVTTKPSGTGLGLSICRQIIEQHGGSIELLTGNSSGAAFQIRLPRAAGQT